MSVLCCPHEDCDKTFTKPSKLEIHIRSHTGERPFVCQVCNASFIRRDHLRRHMTSHSDTREWTCSWPDCQMSFKHKQYLTRHLKTHSKASFQCTMEGCLATFSKKSQLKSHVLSAHSRDTGSDGDGTGCCSSRKGTMNAYVCGIEGCLKSFDYPSALRYHQISIHEAGGVKYICGHPDCQRGDPVTFQRKEDLKNHTREQHGRLKFTCEHCGKTFGSRKNLRGHERLKHEAIEGGFECEDCGKRFSTLPYLKKHAKYLHSGIKYPCDGCGSNFATRGSLKRHAKICGQVPPSPSSPDSNRPSIANITFKRLITGFEYEQRRKQQRILTDEQQLPISVPVVCE